MKFAAKSIRPNVATQWRFGKNGLLSGGVSIGRQLTDTCFLNDFPQVTGIVAQAGAGGATAVGARDPKYCSNAAQPLWSAIGSQVKLQAVYPLPYDFIISGTYKHLPGGLFSAQVTYPNAVVAQSLGRNLSTCAAPTGACTVAPQLDVMIPGENYDQRLNQIDLRVLRRFAIGKARVSPALELYNLTNSRAPQVVTTAWGAAPAAPSAAFLRPAALLGGRLLKFGGQSDW